MFSLEGWENVLFELRSERVKLTISWIVTSIRSKVTVPNYWITCLYGSMATFQIIIVFCKPKFCLLVVGHFHKAHIWFITYDYCLSAKVLWNTWKSKQTPTGNPLQKQWSHWQQTILTKWSTIKISCWWNFMLLGKWSHKYLQGLKLKSLVTFGN